MTDNLKLNFRLVEMLSKKATDINQHLLTLFNLVVENKFKVVVELGAGQSTYVLTVAVKKIDGNFWSIDYKKEAHLRDFPEGKGLLEKEPKYHFIQADSVDITKIWGQKIDFLLIDTSHERTHTKAELYAWTPFLKIGGKIAMHDTFHKMGHAVGCRVGLEEFLHDNKSLYSVIHHEHQCGLSILTKLK